MKNLQLLGGDARFFWTENITDFANLPSAWDTSLNTGIGKSALSSLWINSYLNFTGLFSNFALSWSWISLLFWILPAILLSFFSSFALFNYLFKWKIKYSLLAGIIYTFNTYFLMILTGGQLGVALAYSAAPLVFLGFIRVIRECKLQTSIIAGLILALQILFDPRLVFITLLASGLYWLFFRKNIIFVFVVPVLVAVLLHNYWIIPLFLTRAPVIPTGFDSLSGFEFFSFADFSHALSLLHPNWPENIFGKVYFLQPEFLILPVLAYSSLLFLSKIKDQKSKIPILFFALLGLLGAFLAKGANPPFGEVNTWLFQHFPGMVIFRDPTKFYILIALSYSMLIPYSIANLSIWISSKVKTQNSKLQLKIQKYLSSAVLLLITYYLLFLISPLWMGEVREKLRPRKVPAEYVQLKDFLVSQPEFFRTLWIPQWQRFGYFSNLHPAIGRYEILKSASASGQIEELTRDSSKKLLKDSAVKYIIVPYDSEGEIFLEDRKYDEEEYQQTIDQLKMVTWLKWLDGFGKIAIFEVSGSKDHFWNAADLEISHSFISPTEYKVEVKNAQKGDLLVFSEGFNENWQAQVNKLPVNSQPYNEFLNSFILPREGNYVLKVYYEPQQWVNIGLTISGATVLAVLVLLRFKKMRNR